MTSKGSQLIRFCLRALDSGRYPNFKWLNIKSRIFILTSVHKRNKRWKKKFLQIFKDYAVSCKRRGKSDPRSRFIAALNKSEFLKKLPTDSKSRVYQILAEKYMPSCLHSLSAREEMMDCNNVSDSGYSSVSDSAASPCGSHVSTDSPLPYSENPYLCGEASSTLLPSFGTDVAADEVIAVQDTMENELQGSKDEWFQNLDDLVSSDFNLESSGKLPGGKMGVEKMMEHYNVSKDDSFDDIAIPVCNLDGNKSSVILPARAGNELLLWDTTPGLTGLGYLPQPSKAVPGQMEQQRVLVQYFVLMK